jgi:hypothetical protein
MQSNPLSVTVNSTTFEVTTHSTVVGNNFTLTWQCWEPQIAASDSLERFVVLVDSMSFDGPDHYPFSMYHTSKKALIDDINTLIEYRRSNMQSIQPQLESYWPKLDFDKDGMLDDDTESDEDSGAMYLEYLALEEKNQRLRTMRMVVNGKEIHMGHFGHEAEFKVMTLDEWFNAN